MEPSKKNRKEKGQGPPVWRTREARPLNVQVTVLVDVEETEGRIKVRYRDDHD